MSFSSKLGADLLSAESPNLRSDASDEIIFLFSLAFFLLQTATGRIPYCSRITKGETVSR
jgi:hypothetical protein